MKQRAFLWLLILSFLKAGAQLYPNIHSYQRTYTLVNHLSQQGLYNQLYSTENLQEWDAAGRTFRSYIPASLQYKNVAGKTVKVSVVKTENGNHFFYTAAQHQLPEMNGRMLDSLFEKEKVIEILELNYDERGRLIKRSRIVLEYPQHLEKDTAWFMYLQKGDSSAIHLRTKTYARSENGGYSSLLAGDFKTGPVIKLSAGSSTLAFNSQNLLSSCSSIYSRYTNGIKDYREEDHIINFTWNKKGLLLRRRDSIIGKSPVLIKDFTYRETPFNLEKEQENFLLLKTPAIKRWLKKDFNPDSLSLLYFTGASDYDMNRSGVYIMQNKIIPVIRLENPDSQYGQMNSEIYTRWQDSSGSSRLQYWTMKLPDVNDTIPYMDRIAAGAVRIPVDNTGIAARPYGMIDAGISVMVKNRLVVFKSGWKALIRERGDTGEKSFAPGFAPSIWPEPIHTEFIFIDPAGEPKYFYENKRLYKIGY